MGFLALCVYVERGGSGLVDKHLFGEDYNDVVVLSSFSIVCPLREGICSYIGDSRDVFNDEVVL